MPLDSEVEFLLALLDFEYPDPVDLFEDTLAELLGIYRHPRTSLSDWRVQRVRAINGAGEEADRLAIEVERMLSSYTQSDTRSHSGSLGSTKAQR